MTKLERKLISLGNPATSRRRQAVAERVANAMLAKAGFFQKPADNEYAEFSPGVQERLRRIDAAPPADAVGINGLRPTWIGRA